MTTTYNAYAVHREFVECSHAHVAGKHDGDSHLLHYGSNVRFTSASLW